MDMHQHLQHIQIMQQLKQENEKLKQEIEFMKQIFNHGDAMVFQMKRFTKKGQPVWINTQKITDKELLELDHSHEVQKILIERNNIKYSDKCL